MAACTGISPSLAQQPAAPAPAPAQFDPSDVYFQGWLLSRDAEKLADQEKYSEALEKLRRAQQLFDTISKTFPMWKREMVQGRRTKTLDSIAVVGPKALKEREERDNVVAELEGGARVAGVVEGETPRPLNGGIPEAPIRPAQPVETLESRRIAELQRQVDELQQRIRATEGGRDSDRATSERMRDAAIAELHKTRGELNRLRREVAEGPVQEEIDALARRINGLEEEKAVMGRALDASRTETREAKAQIDALQAERARLIGQVEGLRQEVADNKAKLELERKTSNEVVAGQLKQIRQLQDELRLKDDQLGKANRRITSLEAELKEVRESFDELQEERDELLRERDQMAALLKLNEAGQLQEVIDQNMALDRELREAKKRLDLLQEDNDATKDDLLQALRDLAISKLRIQEFRRERDEQQQRINQLQQRLQQEARGLADNSDDPGEAEMLRSIINKQLRIQKKRSEARDMLLATLKEKASGDVEIRRAVETYQGAELNLTPEELKVIDGQEVDGVIISPYARPRSEVERSLAGLDRELEPYRKAGVRAYQNGRLRAAREAFEMIIERHPGDSTSMCRLGLVEYKLEETIGAAEMFRRATEIDPKNPYAHRMLAHLLSKLGDQREAAISARRAVELAPSNEQGHLILGKIQALSGDFDLAVESFKIAISCDPTNAEAHYNIAALCARQGRKKEGLEHYKKALELGAPPNLDLEKRLSR
ncbi:tetratricopeptide repeat-containing protein [Haloferula helveola]|uniref:Tetratricopeptide repeat-containing protein n=1 Tax=Haloferula helveola TaxID=490095 RepID=A0ABM7R8Y7_9BACT|nr:tetratricopeptide repeat-containing protein [Haloferula helveola]